MRSKRTNDIGAGSAVAPDDCVERPQLMCKAVGRRWRSDERAKNVGLEVADISERTSEERWA